MKTAKEMFEELGYEQDICEGGIWYTNLENDNTINFNDEKYIELLGDFEILSLDELKAINKMVEEMHWNE